MPESCIYTIGHSTQPIESFVDLLQQHEIGFVIDVRSTPYSRRVPHFNREPLRAFLQREGIRYGHMPQEFGARHEDPDLLDAEQRVDFDRVRASEPFRRGVARLKEGVRQGHRITLMCAEADPFDCHRFTMISYQLVREGFTVQHILRDGQLLDNSVLEQRMIERYGFAAGQPELFSAAGEAPLEQAYRRRGREVAYQIRGAEG